MADDTRTWELIHAERRSLADTLDSLSAGQWTTASLCAGWTVHLAAAHILAGAEQTPLGFMTGLAGSGFRFSKMVAKDLRRLGVLSPQDIVGRLRARTTTTNRPPAPTMAMLGEIVVHGADIRAALGLPSAVPVEAITACLDMFRAANFPVGSKRRIAGLRLVATDTDWMNGDGPEVTGPAAALLLAMTGRAAGLAALSGEGMSVIRERL